MQALTGVHDREIQARCAIAQGRRDLWPVGRKKIRIKGPKLTCCGQREIDRFDQRKQCARRVAMPQTAMREDCPHRGMALPATILTQAGQIALDLSGVLRSGIERQREQQGHPSNRPLM